MITGITFVRAFAVIALLGTTAVQTQPAAAKGSSGGTSHSNVQISHTSSSSSKHVCGHFGPGPHGPCTPAAPPTSGSSKPINCKAGGEGCQRQH